ncbi:ROK family protein [Peristeroidobacter agariperforans]|uniref:ROK family protein n=1 Tax=Peristeroidobacter agariperforans TaxID=268404 RepID=UPI001300BEB6|nr:ROK family protein [Peristeroidobacter agariperforans]
MLYGAIEGGGTKFVCALGASSQDVLDSVVLPTASAASTLAACVEFFSTAAQKFGPIAAFGFACFGPIDLRVHGPGYGQMLATPKAGWSGVDLLKPLRSRFAAPVSIDTDVSAAALAEWQLGAGRGLGSIAYVTVGTGIGGGVAPHDLRMRRLMHAEMGHIFVRRDARDQDFPGVCPFHGDCLEGLASGRAIQARWRSQLDALPPHHEAWSIIGGYLGQLVATIALVLSVERVVFGGGVMANGLLLPHIRAAAAQTLKGYLEPLSQPGALDSYICGPQLGTQAGIAGAFLLAERALASVDDQPLPGGTSN